MGVRVEHAKHNTNRYTILSVTSPKDYSDNNKSKLITLDGVEFIRRFLMHILPKRFVKIRHFGLLGNRNKKNKAYIV
uniref:transposase n=1 Tax=Anaerovirgula multivorans TaxID=312168 RepID=UPI001A9A4B74